MQGIVCTVPEADLHTHIFYSHAIELCVVQWRLQISIDPRNLIKNSWNSRQMPCKHEPNNDLFHGFVTSNSRWYPQFVWDKKKKSNPRIDGTVNKMKCINYLEICSADGNDLLLQFCAAFHHWRPEIKIRSIFFRTQVSCLSRNIGLFDHIFSQLSMHNHVGRSYVG